MANFTNNILSRLKQKDILVQIIVLNIAVFIILNVLGLISVLFKLQSFNVLQYIGAPSTIETLFHRPWTFISYMFVHEGIFHILFNMLMLYWFGQLFLSYFNPKNLGSLYILGGLGGVVLYLIAFNTIPYYIDMNPTILVGASASVTAIIFAAAFYRPNAEIGLLFLGRIKIIYIALLFFVLDFISLTDKANPGGHVAHIGGAITGYIYAKQYLRGKDITRWINRLIDSIVNIFKRRPAKMKVKHKKQETDYEYNSRKHNDSANIDKILDKIKISGYSSLTETEKKQLFDASKK